MPRKTENNGFIIFLSPFKQRKWSAEKIHWCWKASFSLASLADLCLRWIKCECVSGILSGFQPGYCFVWSCSLGGKAQEPKLCLIVYKLLDSSWDTPVFFVHLCHIAQNAGWLHSSSIYFRKEHPPPPGLGSLWHQMTVLNCNLTRSLFLPVSHMLGLHVQGSRFWA